MKRLIITLIVLLLSSAAYAWDFEKSQIYNEVNSDKYIDANIPGDYKIYIEKGSQEKDGNIVKAWTITISLKSGVYIRSKKWYDTAEKRTTTEISTLYSANNIPKKRSRGITTDWQPIEPDSTDDLILKAITK